MPSDHVIPGKTTPPTGALLLESYPVFVPQQALASADLNQLTTYLKTQGQLTRNSLLGVGILSGLLVSHSFSEGGTPTGKISLSSGTCVTPDGYYVSLDDTVLTHYQLLATGVPPNETQTPIELFVESPRNDRIPLHQTFEKVNHGEDTFKAFLSNKILLLVVELIDEARTGLLSYDVVTQGHNLVARFFLLPFPSENQLDDDAFLVTHGFSVLKQQRELQKLLAQQPPYPSLRRLGAVMKTAEGGSEDVSVNLTALNTYIKVQLNYVRVCVEAIKTIAKTIQQVDALKSRFSLLQNAILQSQPSQTADFSFVNLSMHLQQQLKAIVELQSPSTRPELLAVFNQAFPQTQSLSPIAAETQTSASPYALQYFYGYLSTIAMAYGELISGILELKDYLPDATRQQFLMLGNVLISDDQATESPALSVSDRSYFIQSVTAQSTLRQVERVAHLYWRLWQLCAPDSFGLPDTTDIRITPSCDRTAPLSQQTIPYYLNYKLLQNYWNYDAHYQGISQALLSYRNPQPHSFLYQSPKTRFYRIEGHVDQSSADALSEIEELRNRHNLAFEIILLKLNTEESEDSSPSHSDKYLFHNFAEAYPGMEHWGGVPEGGTFLLIYVEDPATETDRVVADVSLPYRIEPDIAQVPPARSIELETTRFRNDDETEHLIQLSPEGGKVEGRGVGEHDDGQFYFQPSQLQSDLNEQINVLLIAWWPDGIKTQTVTVYAQPAATFRLDDHVSGVDTQGAVISVGVKRESLPLILTPDIPGGTFQVLNLQNEAQDNLIQGSPPRFALPQNSELTDVKIIYTLPNTTPWGEQSSTLQVQVEPIPPLPAEPTLSIGSQSFQKDDSQKHILTLTPPGGRVEGRGVSQEKDEAGNDVFYFQPSKLQNDLNEQINILLIAWWSHGIDTETVTVYSRSLARFWMERQPSGPDSQGQDVFVEIEATSPPLFLKPKIQEGDFSIYNTSDPQKTPLNNLIDQESLLFIPQNIKTLTSVTIEYTLKPENLGTPISNSIIVQIQRPTPPPSASDENIVTPPNTIPPNVSDTIIPDTKSPNPGTFADISNGNSAALNVPIAESSGVLTLSNSAAPNTLIPEFILHPSPTTNLANDKQSTTLRSTPGSLISNEDTASVSPNSAPMRRKTPGATSMPAPTKPAPQPSFWRRMVQIMTAPIG